MAGMKPKFKGQKDRRFNQAISLVQRFINTPAGKPFIENDDALRALISLCGGGYLKMHLNFEHPEDTFFELYKDSEFGECDNVPPVSPVCPADEKTEVVNG